jgi:hypothetical protein
MCLASAHDRAVRRFPRCPQTSTRGCLPGVGGRHPTSCWAGSAPCARMSPATGVRESGLYIVIATCAERSAHRRAGRVLQRQALALDAEPTAGIPPWVLLRKDCCPASAPRRMRRANPLAAAQLGDDQPPSQVASFSSLLERRGRRTWRCLHSAEGDMRAQNEGAGCDPSGHF